MSRCPCVGGPRNLQSCDTFSVDDWDCCWPLSAEYLATRRESVAPHEHYVVACVDWQDAVRRRWCGSVAERGPQTMCTVWRAAGLCTSRWTESSDGLIVSSYEHLGLERVAVTDVAARWHLESGCRFHPSSAFHQFAILPAATSNNQSIWHCSCNKAQ